MIIQIPLDESFLAPEGTYQGTLTEVRNTDRPSKKGAQKYIRLVFDLEPIDEGIQYRVGRDFPASDLKVLKSALKDWLGTSVAGKRIDINTLVGTRATLEIVHIAPKGDHDEAYRWVSKILPPEQPLEEAA